MYGYNYTDIGLLCSMYSDQLDSFIKYHSPDWIAVGSVNLVLIEQKMAELSLCSSTQTEWHTVIQKHELVSPTGTPAAVLGLVYSF